MSHFIIEEIVKTVITAGIFMLFILTLPGLINRNRYDKTCQVCGEKYSGRACSVCGYDARG